MSGREESSALSVGKIMVTDVPVVNVDKNVKEAAALMEKKDYGCLVVIDADIAAGIVTESDIVLKVTAEGVDPSKVLVQDIMSSPLIRVTNKASIRDVAEKMSTLKVRKIVVTDENGGIIGLVTAIDLAKWLSAKNNYSDLTLNALAKVGQLRAVHMNE